MNNIIDNLGIKPLKRYNSEKWMIDDGIWCKSEQVEELEQQNRVMLEALIDDVYKTDTFIKKMPNLLFQDVGIARHEARIELIEKIAKMPWKQIKELYYEEN